MIARVSDFNIGKFILGAAMFTAAYLTTITVNAQETQAVGDAIQVNTNSNAVITGTIVDADENWLIINAAGREMRVTLDDVELNGEADDVFAKGMSVTVNGEMEGNDFGMPIVEAKSVTATAQPPTNFYQNRTLP